MSTLNELKDWIEKGGKIAQDDWCGGKWLRKCCEQWVDEDGINAGLGPDMSLASNWVKVEETPKRWKPENEGEYYFVSRDGMIYTDIWRYFDTDIRTSDFYNCFKTHKEAEQARELWLAERELRSLVDDGYYNICYMGGSGFIAVQNALNGCPYHFSTREKADAAIKRLGEEKLKLIFGVN